MVDGKTMGAARTGYGAGGVAGGSGGAACGGVPARGFAGRPWGALIAWVVAAVALAAILWVAGGSLAEQGREQGAVSLRDSVLQTAMQCYAIEGIYPQDLAYLEEYYGLTVNHDLYAVTYEAFASNVMPSVVVTLR